MTLNRYSGRGISLVRKIRLESPLEVEGRNNIISRALRKLKRCGNKRNDGKSKSRGSLYAKRDQGPMDSSHMRERFVRTWVDVKPHVQ